MANTVDLNEIEEFEDKPDELSAKISLLASMVKSCKHLVAFTGAGISTSASIPDFRGPKGVWTLKAQGKTAGPRKSFDDAIPTPCHMALKALQDRGELKYIVSQNVDGMHRRSGILKERISELHGNCYLEVCWKCSYEELEHKEVRQRNNGKNGGRCRDCVKRVKHFCHCTLRHCPKCRAPMKDSIIHFGEDLPQKALDLAYLHGATADLMLVLGSSLRVSPANDVPEETTRKGGKLVIVNLQKTPLDGLASLRIFAKTDLVCQLLMGELAVDIPRYVPHRILYIGNTYAHVQAPQAAGGDPSGATPPKNSNKWTVFLRGEEGTDLTPFIDSVSFHLHPTFKPPVVTVNAPPYETTRLGWGTFTINIVVTLKNGLIAHYSHELDFTREETCAKHSLFLQQETPAPELMEEGDT